MKGAFDKLTEIRPMLPAAAKAVPVEDEFLSVADLIPAGRTVVKNRMRAVLAEMGELMREKQWQAIVDLFFPVAEKLPELADAGRDTAVREKTAFALGQLGRFDDAIGELTICAEREPESFHVHSALAYTAYSSLFAARNREILLSGKLRAERISLAHTHFEKAGRLRPEGVTNFYRHGMLWHKIEGKPVKALPLFDRAAANWERLDAEEKDRRRQEHKNYVKALYQLAGILLARGDLTRAAERLKGCLAEDEQSDYLLRVHKYFALGKLEYHCGRFEEAKSALLFAERCRGNTPIDFVFELLARVHLGLHEPGKALAAVERVPEKHRRPYFRWTEADVLCAQGRFEQAKAVLAACNERDRRSRHKGLIRLCRIEYLLGDDRTAAAHARAADDFFRSKWTNPCAEALFWLAASRLRAGDIKGAATVAEELRAFQPDYPKLDRLLARINHGGGANEP